MNFFHWTRIVDVVLPGVGVVIQQNIEDDEREKARYIEDINWQTRIELEELARKLKKPKKKEEK